MPDSDLDPAEFYTGLVAELYGPLKGHPQTAGPYARFIATSGQPALELGCGDGEPLLDLVAQGLDVDGVDSSADMLQRCRARADARGIDVTLYHQRMEDLAIDRRYRSIFLAGPTFNLLPDDEAALRALHRIADHLDDDGTALVPLFVPEPTHADAFQQPRRATGSDGADLQLFFVSEQRDDDRRTQRTVLRYERTNGGDRAVAVREWLLHWYSPDGFVGLAAQAGLVADVRSPGGGPVPAEPDEWVTHLRPA